MSGTLSVLVVRALAAALASAGADPRALLDEVGVPPEALDRPEARLPASVVFRAIERAADLTRDELFCLRAADAIPIGALETLDFAMRSSATIGDALGRAARYYALVDDRTELSAERAGDVARLVGRNRTIPAAPRAATELLFALALARGRQLTGQAWPLHRVAFRAEPPRDVRGHEEFFGVPVHFGQAVDELVFDASFLDAPCLTRDEALAAFFDRHALASIAQLPATATFAHEVRRAIAEALGTDPGLEATARRLRTSARTLQRRLGEEGTSHKEVLEAVRREMAAKLLADADMSVGEVAYLLGFFDPSTFHRAFKRWTGTTPAEFRRDAQRGSSVIAEAAGPPEPASSRRPPRT